MALAERITSAALENAPSVRRIFIYGINYSPEPTGVGRYTGEIGEYLARQGLEIDVVTAVPHYPGWAVRNDHRNRYSVERAAHTRVTRCPLLLKTDMRGAWRMLAPLSFAVTSGPVAIWQILTTRPDTVLCIEPTLFSAPAALLAAKLVGARTVLHVQDLEIDAAFAVGHLHGGLLQKFATMIERSVLRAFDAIVTISNRMQQNLELKGVPKQRLRLVRNWVNLEKVKPLDGSPAYRRELGLSDETFVALYAGNVGPKQALPIVLDAAEHLTAETKLVFVIAGDGPEKKRLMARYGHLSNVRFLPVQPEERLCELLNLADVHVLPQDRGAVDLVLPSKLGGMLASGKPCVVMAEPSTELFEFLGDGAIILPPGDSVVLADVVKRVVHNAGHRPIGDNNNRIVALDAKQILPAFRAILEGPG